MLSIDESLRKIIQNDPYFIEKKNEVLRSDLFKADVNSCPFLDSQRIHTGACVRVIYVYDSFSPQDINSPVLT